MLGQFFQGLLIFRGEIAAEFVQHLEGAQDALAGTSQRHAQDRFGAEPGLPIHRAVDQALVVAGVDPYRYPVPYDVPHHSLVVGHSQLQVFQPQGRPSHQLVPLPIPKKNGCPLTLEQLGGRFGHVLEQLRKTSMLVPTRGDLQNPLQPFGSALGVQSFAQGPQRLKESGHQCRFVRAAFGRSGGFPVANRQHLRMARRTHARKTRPPSGMDRPGRIGRLGHDSNGNRLCTALRYRSPRAPLRSRQSHARRSGGFFDQRKRLGQKQLFLLGGRPEPEHLGQRRCQWVVRRQAIGRGKRLGSWSVCHCQPFSNKQSDYSILARRCRPEGKTRTHLVRRARRSPGEAEPS